LNTIATAFATVIASNFGDEFDVLFGPAYKGIPYAGATALVLQRDHGIDVGYAYDRKEVKAHGEGGMMVGASVRSKRVLVLDDVMTAGTAIRNSVKIVETEGGTVVGFVMILDREEIGPGGESTVKEVERLIGRPGSMHSIIKMRDLIDWLKDKSQDEEMKSMLEYFDKHGSKA
jgi:orotate phosphoribosyltransferase